MGELFKRLKSYPGVTVELLCASLFANVLALASSLFVIQVLNRYVSNGVDATLYTLTAGVLLAIFFEVSFRQIRVKIANALAVPFDRDNAIASYGTLLGARADVLAQLSPGQKREAASASDAIQQAYAAPNMAAYLDLPFSLVFLLALALLSAPLAGVTVIFVTLAIALGAFNLWMMKAPTERLQKNMAERQGLLDSALTDPDTVRAFTAAPILRKRWTRMQDAMDRVRSLIAARQGGAQNITQGLQAVMSTAIIAIGGMLVVTGNLDVGLLIGSNILASRTLGPVVRMTQLAGTLAKAKAARATLDGLMRLPQEARQGAALGAYRGAIELKDLGFAYPGQPTPLFESLSLKLEPGTLFVVTGANGTGKTTLARLLAGLIAPARGQILVDGTKCRPNGGGAKSFTCRKNRVFSAAPCAKTFWRTIPLWMKRV